MKHHILALLLVLFISDYLIAQTNKRHVPISIGIYAPYGTQPGGNIGTHIDLKEWETEKISKEKTYINSKKLFFSPQLGIFVRPKNHTSYILNVDIGYRMKRSNRRIYIAPSLGLGYILENRILGKTIDLSNGNNIDKDKELRHLLLPTLNFEISKEPKKQVGWFLKLSYGRKISSQIEDSAFTSLELGIKFNLQLGSEK